MEQPSTESAATACFHSIFRGSVIGSVIGLGFHVAGGGYVKSKGRTSLTTQHIAKEAARASLRLGGVFGTYSAVRCALLQATGGSDAISCGTAGALAVVVPTVADQGRLTFLREYYGEMFNTLLSKEGGSKSSLPKHARAGMKVTPASVPLVVAISAMSGAVVFGLPDMLAHRLLGLRW